MLGDTENLPPANSVEKVVPRSCIIIIIIEREKLA